VGTVGPGECVGEGALLLSGRRAATVVAEAPTRLLRLSREAFEEALAAHAELRSLLTALVARRLPALRAVDSEIFAALDGPARAAIEREMAWVHLERDQVLFREGDAADALYVVLQGRLQVIRERAGGAADVLTEVGRGEPVGEMALLTGEPRSTTVRAVRDTELMRLSAAGFTALLQTQPAALAPLLRTLARRLDRASAALPRAASRATVIAVVPLGGAPVDAFNEALLTGLRASGRVRALDAASFDAEHGTGAAQTPPDSLRALYLTEWLHGQEAAHDALVLIADAERDAWSRRCVSQADRVLLVARAGDTPGLGAFAPLVGPGRTTAARDLVLLHLADARRPSGTAAWLDATGVERHHHVRAGNAADAQRVSRFLARRAVGLVLSGGGARGFAHAGVVRALAEAGVPIDFVGGVSMGSLVGACHALGFDFASTVDTLESTFVKTRPHRGYTLPLVSVFAPRKVERAMEEVFADTRIEDLWLNYFCVATNLTRARLEVFRRGPVFRAMRASGSFPGLLPPVPFAGDLLVDGGLLDNLPVELLQGLCPGPVLASDTYQEEDLGVDRALERSPTALAAVLQHLRPPSRRRGVPGPATVVLRSMDVHQLVHRRAQRAAAAFVFKLPLEGFGLIDFPKIGPIVEAGYRYAAAAISSLPAEIPRGPGPSLPSARP
jgi:predicted acylesterase/phospholipase RssA/CRP-like cAMP-binding protein